MQVLTFQYLYASRRRQFVLILLKQRAVALLKQPKFPHDDYVVKCFDCEEFILKNELRNHVLKNHYWTKSGLSQALGYDLPTYMKLYDDFLNYIKCSDCNDFFSNEDFQSHFFYNHFLDGIVHGKYSMPNELSIAFNQEKFSPIPFQRAHLLFEKEFQKNVIPKIKDLNPYLSPFEFAQEIVQRCKDLKPDELQNYFENGKIKKNDQDKCIIFPCISCSDSSMKTEGLGSYEIFCMIAVDPKINCEFMWHSVFSIVDKCQFQEMANQINGRKDYDIDKVLEELGENESKVKCIVKKCRKKSKKKCKTNKQSKSEDNSSKNDISDVNLNEIIEPLSIVDLNVKKIENFGKNQCAIGGNTESSNPVSKYVETLEVENKNLKKSQQFFEKENQSLKESKFCKICMDNEINIVLVPCGHFISCDDCASCLKFCPMCRRKINVKVKTYMS